MYCGRAMGPFANENKRSRSNNNNNNNNDTLFLSPKRLSIPVTTAVTTATNIKSWPKHQETVAFYIRHAPMNKFGTIHIMDTR
jgi:hypothetical protein